MEQTKQSNKTPETQQKNKPENSGDSNQSGAIGQGMGQSQEATPKDRTGNSSSPSFKIEQGQDEKGDERYQNSNQGSMTSRPNPSESGAKDEKDDGGDRDTIQNGSGQQEYKRDEGGSKTDGQQKLDTNSSRGQL